MVVLPATEDNPGNNQQQTVETGTITITVTDGTDTISGATVTIDGESKTTNATGKVEFTDMEYTDYTATVTKTGYEDATESINFRTNRKNFTITLVAEEINTDNP